MIQKQFHFDMKVGVVGSGLMMAGLMLVAIWHAHPVAETAEVWRKLFGTSVITCLVTLLAAIFSWDGSL